MYKSQYARNLIEANLGPFVTLNSEGKITDVNEASIKITGVSREALIGTDFSDYFTEQNKAKKGYQQVFEKGFIANYPLTIKHKNGKLTDVLYNASVYKDKEGNVVEIFAAARDITAEKLASQYPLSLIEASLDPLVTINTDGKITDMNEALVNITGSSRNELTSSDFFNYFTEKQKASEVYQEVFKKGFVADSPLTLRHKNGKLTDVLFNGSVYKDPQGNVIGVVIVARDIAGQKWALDLQIANKELAFQNKEKEKRAAELIIANHELAFQNDEKEKRADELSIANKELAFQNDEKEKRANELIIANKELLFQNDEKEKRAAELVIANKELAFQNDEKEKRANELIIANKELLFQNDEKEKRAAELIIANKELLFQNKEKVKREIAHKELEELSYTAKLASQYSLSLIEASRDPLVTINTQGKITDMNEALVNITGIDRKILIGSDFFDYFTEPQKAREVYQEVFAEGSVADSLLTLRHKGGKLTDVLFNGSVYKDDRGNVLGVVIVARDVTAQKLAYQYARSLIEASLDPLFTISPEGKITDMNNASVKVTGISREKLIGTDFFDYFTEPKKARAGYQQVFNKGFIADYPLTIKDHKLTDVLLNGSVYKDSQGHVLGVVVVARDITEQKRIATELVEARVFAELATEIAEEAKINAESATIIAENAVKAKQQFLSNMSHEIRTPMNAIIGFTKVILKTDLSTKQKEFLNAIKMSGDALIVLINDILDLAKVDAGKMTFEKTPFKMKSSIAAMLHLFETKIQEKNLSLIKEYDSKIPNVLIGDPVRLHQIILNLVSNAVKFTTNGIITVGVHLLHEDDDKVVIEFAVTDTGIGIPEDKIGKIFDNFQQASSGTSRLYGGTGLGLAIVKQLVEPQGGNIRVKSKINEGSTFSFTLSFQKTTADAELENELMELDTEIKNIKVLVVEDIPLNQLLMKTLLDDFGFDRDIAENGKIAIEKLKNKDYDIILMDLQMPEMNGFEATEYIRNTLNSKIPIIALTADVTTVDLAKCKAVGMNDYLAKPVDERLLYSKIVGILKKPKLTKLSAKLNENLEEKDDTKKKVKCIDLVYLNQRTKSNPALMMEMISLYLAQTPPLIATIKQSLADQNWSLLGAATHKMIPSFSIMGISPNFENIAKKIQDFASAQEKSNEIQDLVLQLEEVCLQACSELQEEFNIIKNTI
jgi:PAS domain S-box-containing protein